MSKAIGVVVEGAVEWHAPGVVSDYDTLCGLDANDPVIGSTGLVAPTRSQKITCPQCRTIWQDMRALRLRNSDFA